MKVLCMDHLCPRFASNDIQQHRTHTKQQKHNRSSNACHRCGKFGHWARDCHLYQNKGTTRYSSISKSTARSSYNTKEPNSIVPMHRYESELLKFIQSNQFNNTAHMLHIMMQQGVKLNNISLFSSILHALKLSSIQEFHVLELIEYMKYNQIDLDSNRFSELLGICVAKNDQYSAKQIAILWFETMPDFPVLSVIHCLSSHNSSSKPANYKFHKLGKQEKIWQSIIDELNNLDPSKSPSYITQKYLTPQSPKDHITELLSQIQVHLTAKNHDLAIKHLHELHAFITKNTDNIAENELLLTLKEQNSALSIMSSSKGTAKHTLWTQWLLRQELMHGDMHKIQDNDTLRKLQELGFNVNSLSALNNLFQEIQKPQSLTNMDLSNAQNSEIIKLQMKDHIHELERRLPFILQFISYNLKIGTIEAGTMNNTQFIEQVITLVVDTAALKTKTSNVSRKVIDDLFNLIRTNLLFQKCLFNDLKQKIIAQHQGIKHARSDTQHTTQRRNRSGAQVMKHAGYISLRKLFEFINGFSKMQLEQSRKIQEMKDILPLMKHCSIQLFYTKAKYLPKQLSSRDLTDAIIEAAFRFEGEPLGHLLYYLFYHHMPYGFALGTNESLTMLPLQIDWRDLHKIYATVLGLSNQAMNQIQEIDMMHLLHYTPLPVHDKKYIEHESDIVTVTRKRQQRVLPLLSGICARLGSFEDVMKSIHYFEHDAFITRNMRSFGAFYLNETLLHHFTKQCVEFKKKESALSDVELVEKVKELTQNVYSEWKECMSQILDRDAFDDRARYAKYLLCIENLSSQIRMRQIAPLAQYLLYILDEYNVAPTWNIYENLWFAFNLNDKYMNVSSFDSDDMSTFVTDNEKEEEEEDTSFTAFSLSAFEADVPMVQSGNILDTKYAELQIKYMTKEHLDYLLLNKRYEEAILMMNKFGESIPNLTDEYKLKCITQYVINCELRNNDCNYYPFALSHWYPAAEPMSAKYFVQRRIDPQNENNVIVSYDWHRKNDDVFIDEEKDITFYIPHAIMKQMRYKASIVQYCRDELFNSDLNEQFAHCQLEILPYSAGIRANKLESNAMKQGYDLFVIRGCKSLEQKLAIWCNMIEFFENSLEILCTVSCDTMVPITNKLNNFMQSICNKHNCVIDSNSISSFTFDAIPTFFIWKSETNSDLKHAQQTFKEYLTASTSSTSSSDHLKHRTLSIHIPWKYNTALNKMFHSDHKQISKDLKYVRDHQRHADIDVNLFAADRNDASKGGILSIIAPTKSLRRRVYQQIFYTHPPSNDTNLQIYDTNLAQDQRGELFEWKNIDEMLFELISSMRDAQALAISNAIYLSRLEKYTNNKMKVWIMNLFAQDEDVLINSAEDMVKLCQLLFSGLSQRRDDNDGIIAQIFYNILSNHNILDIVNDSRQNTVCQLLYCTILSLCNESMHNRSLSMSDFHRVRAAFLHCYCQHSENDEQGINANLSHCLEELTQHESYMMIWLEYLYVSCLMNNPNLSGHITRFLNELLTLMVHETHLDTSTYSQFCSSALDLLLIDIQSPQQQCAQDFLSMYHNCNMENMDAMHPKHVIYSEIDVESLKIILSELNPLEIEHINVPHKSIQSLYQNLCTGFSLCGNVECIKLLLNRVEFLSKSHQTNTQTNEQLYTFGIDDGALHEICQNVFNYYHYNIGYDGEITAHHMMQLLECMLSGENKLWTHIIAMETITEYAIWMAENELMQQMHSLKQLMETNDAHKFETLIKVLNDVDYSLYLQDSSSSSSSHIYPHIDSVVD